MMRIRTPAPNKTFDIIVLVILLLGAFGWVYNILKLIGGDTLTGLETARIIGIVFAPLGSILGYL
jgi:hypothetical protein